jgi:hypothetical protein
VAGQAGAPNESMQADDQRPTPHHRMIGDDDIITLRDAAEHFGFSVYTLRTEANRGRLTIYEIGKRLYTKPADIKEMVNKCRVVQEGRDFTLIRRGNSSSSETDRASSALAAANETALRLKNSSKNTLGKSIVLSRRARR